MKKISIITIVIGALMLIVGVAPLLLSFLMVPNTPSVGIIGGADFSATLRIAYIFWTGSFYHHLAFWGVIALIAGVVLLIISKFRKKQSNSIQKKHRRNISAVFLLYVIK